MHISLAHLITTCGRLPHHTALLIHSLEKKGRQLISIYEDMFDLRNNMSFYTQ